jgi:hypothetical protein
MNNKAKMMKHAGFHGSFFMSVGSELGGNAPCHSDGEDDVQKRPLELFQLPK